VKFCEGCFKPVYQNEKHECPADRAPSPTAPAKGLEAPPRVWIYTPRGKFPDYGNYYTYIGEVPSSGKIDYLSLQEAEHLLRQARAEAFEEAIKEVDAWLDLLEIDHRDIIAKGQYKDPQEAGREYRNKCNLLGAVRASISKLAKAAEARGEGK
jgi:hypothetical protein